MGLNAEEEKEVQTAEARKRKKEGCISNLKLQLRFPTEGDIEPRIDNFIFQITNIFGGHVNSITGGNKEKLFKNILVKVPEEFLLSTYRILKSLPLGPAGFRI